jgi:sulfide dehydrogenase [flavocytochrome c] flavoprotein subunit
MTQNISRRSVLKASAAGAVATGMASFGFAPSAFANTKKVVVVGGGIGGATAAKYLKKLDSSIDVTVIEANADYYTCFMSNEVLSGERDINGIKFGYDGLKGHGVNVVIDKVTGIDAAAQTVTTAGGKTFAYDRCIVSPGVHLNYDAIEGYSKEASKEIPHAWKAGKQTTLLRAQLENMKDGGTFVMIAPPNPFRCPPGPYERASQVAHYFKTHKPNSKVVILDPKPKFSKQGLFMDGWARHYGDMITWVGKDAGGEVAKIDAATKTVTMKDGKTYQADVLNVIPPMVAGSIAKTAGLTNEAGWCPIDLKTFESTIHKNIHVIGDASVASPMPKSGYAANSQAKVCAAAVYALMNGKTMVEPSWVNTCYSVIAPKDGISVAAVYKYEDGKIVAVQGAGGLTPKEFDPIMRAREEQYAHSWFKNITVDVFG